MTKYLFILKPILKIADNGARLRWHKTSNIGRAIGADAFRFCRASIVFGSSYPAKDLRARVDSAEQPDAL